ncbi:MAG: flagellar motor protein MotB [Dongiaceae bacterium]
MRAESDSSAAAAGPPGPFDDPVWLITFADLVGLMLAFFVMLFAMSNIDGTKWRGVANGLSRSLDPVIAIEDESPRAERNVVEVTVEPGSDLDYLATLLAHELAAEPALAAAVLRSLDDRIVISLPADLLFEPISARLGGPAAPTLFALGGLLRNLDNRIEVAGHADRRAIDSTDYPSNWELSLARALAVAEALRESGYGRPIVARGYGDSRFNEISPRLAAARREALARRVDVVIREAGGGAE